MDLTNTFNTHRVYTPAVEIISRDLCYEIHRQKLRSTDFRFLGISDK